jgi:hypothetical protein
LTVTQNGVERELTIDEALQLQTYQAALKGSKLAIRAVLKMIEKRETALAKNAPASHQPIKRLIEHDTRNADEAMLLLGITVRDPSWTDGECQYGVRMKLANWAAQAGISRPGRRKLSQKQVDSVKWDTLDPDKLKWPRGSIGE